MLTLTPPLEDEGVGLGEKMPASVPIVIEKGLDLPGSTISTQIETKKVLDVE
jgi:hypothetical protein